MLKEMAGLGFERVELSHGIRITLVPGILRAVEEGVVRVGSTHNFCPLPMGVHQAAPNFYQPSSGSEQEREQWVRQTKRSIDFAAQVGAGALICHLGSVRYLWLQPDRKMEAYLRRNPGAARSGDPVYRVLVDKALEKLRARMEPSWRRTLDCLRGVLDYAAERKIVLGLENREALTELPLDADFPALLAAFPPPAPVGYWHDCGHGQLKERRGLISQRAQLEANAPRQLGFHLHDVDAGGNDHQPVGSGTVDFGMVSGFWRPEHLFVIELSPRVPVDGVIQSKARVEELLGPMGAAR